MISDKDALNAAALIFADPEIGPALRKILDASADLIRAARAKGMSDVFTLSLVVDLVAAAAIKLADGEPSR